MTKNKQRGNAFIFVLLGITLFAALTYTVARSMRSQTTTSLSARQAVLAATDMLDYVQRLERGIGQLRRRGVSENDISFDSPNVAGYTHGQPDANKLFHFNGANVKWKSVYSGANDGSDWIFTGLTCIADIGSGATGCDSDGLSNEELIAVLENVGTEVCNAINKRLGITGIPTDGGGGHSTTKFVGTFSDSTEIILGSSYNQACYTDGTDNHFYSVLLSR